MTQQVHKHKKKKAQEIVISQEYLNALNEVPEDFGKLQSRVDRVFEIGRAAGLDDKRIGKDIREKMKEDYSTRTITRVFEKYPDAKQKQNHEKADKMSTFDEGYQKQEFESEDTKPGLELDMEPPPEDEDDDSNSNDSNGNVMGSRTAVAGKLRFPTDEEKECEAQGIGTRNTEPASMFQFHADQFDISKIDEKDRGYLIDGNEHWYTEVRKLKKENEELKKELEGAIRHDRLKLLLLAFKDKDDSELGAAFRKIMEEYADKKTKVKAKSKVKQK